MTIWHIFILRASQVACERINAGWEKRDCTLIMLSFFIFFGIQLCFKCFRVNYSILQPFFVHSWGANLKLNKGRKDPHIEKWVSKGCSNKTKTEPKLDSSRPFILFFIYTELSYLNACKYCYNNSFMYSGLLPSALHLSCLVFFLVHYTCVRHWDTIKKCEFPGTNT